jgi:polyisoprenoid-binding protein YceI
MMTFAPALRKTAAALALAALLALPTASSFAADTYKLDPTHTSVVWNADHLGFSRPHGLFAMIEGTLVLDEKAPENSKVDVVVKTENIFTGQKDFDDHLKNKDFFNVAEFPVATFKSTKVERTGDKTAKVSGDLTMLGVTKPVTLDVTLNKIGPNPRSQVPTVGFSASGVIKRSEFGMNYAIPGVSDEVRLQIEAEATKE